MRHNGLLTAAFCGLVIGCSSSDETTIDAAPALTIDAPLAVDGRPGGDAPIDAAPTLTVDARFAVDARPGADATLLISCGPPPVNCHVVVDAATECPSVQAFCATKPMCIHEIFTCCACGGALQVTMIECNNPCDAAVARPSP